MTIQWLRNGSCATMAILLALFAREPRAHGQEQETALSPGTFVEREIGGSEAHVYRLPLGAGEVVRLLVEQPEANVVLTILPPTGTSPLKINNYNQHEAERALLLAETTGDFRITIQVAGSRAAHGRYVLRVEQTRRATPKDLEALVAERNFSAGRLLLLDGTTDAINRAITFFEPALAQSRELSDRYLEAETLLAIGFANEMQQKWQAAIDAYEPAARKWNELSHPRFESVCLNGIGWNRYLLGQYEQALDPLQRALALRQVQGIARETAQSLTTLALLHSKLGDGRIALEKYRQTLPLARASGDKTQVAYALNSMAQLYLQLAEVQQALHLLQEALSLWREVGNVQGEAAALNLLGMAYDNILDPAGAKASFAQALEISAKNKDRYMAALCLNNLAIQYYREGEYEKALAQYQSALEYWREIGNRAEEQAVLNNIGLLHMDKGEAEAADRSFRLALDGRTAGQYRSGDERAMYNLGLNRLRQEAPRPALDWLHTALALSEKGIAYRLRADLLVAIADAHRRLEELEPAREAAEQAIEFLEKSESETTLPGFRLSAQGRGLEAYKIQADLMGRYHAREPEKGYAAKAFQYSERFRARSLLDLLAESRVDLYRNIDPKMLARMKDLQLKLNVIEERRAGSVLRRQAEASPVLDRQIAELLREKDLVEAQIRAANPQYAGLKSTAPRGLTELQSLLPPDTIVLEYLLFRDYGYLWLVRRDGLSLHRIASHDKIERAGRRLFEMLSRPPAAPDSETLRQKQDRERKLKAEFDLAAAELSELSLGPVREHLKNKRLVIVADGMLHFIPIGILPVPAGAGRSNAPYRPLMLDHEISYLPSLSALSLLRERRRDVLPNAERSVAILADPVFNFEDTRVQITRQSAPGNDRNLPRNFPPGERSAEASPPNGYRRLLFSRLEAEAISALLPAGRRLRALDFSADRELVLSDQLTDYSILHFATHGLIDSQTPAMSGLVLSLIDERGLPKNGFLRLHNIFNLKLRADLVVLSGCHTAFSKLIYGEGLVGMTRGFMYAGAPRVVASLWNVNDQATAHLMKSFYEGMLQQKLSPSAALRAAQIQAWKQSPNTIPSRWAAFILQGDWQ